MADEDEQIFMQFSEDIFNSSSNSNVSLLNVSESLSDTPTPLHKVRLDLQNNDAIGLGCLNASSAIKHIDEIRRLLSQTGLIGLAICESFYKNNTPMHRKSIAGFQLFTENRTGTTQGGLAFYIRDEVKARKIKIPQDHNLPELMCTVLTINNKEIAVAVLYKRPTVSYKKLDDIVDHITQFTCTYDETIIMGDININQLDRSSPDFKFFNSNILEPLSLTQVIDKPTRITEDTRKCIDVIMVSNKEKCLCHGVAPTYSDHHLVYMSYDIKKPKFIPKKITKRDMKNFCAENFLIDIQRTPWHLIGELQDHDVDNKVTALENMLNKVIDKHAPTKTFTIREQPLAQWMNKNIQKDMDHRDKLLEKCYKSGKAGDWANFRKARNEVSHKQRRAKKQHINKIVNSKVNDSKTFFQNLKKNGIIEDKKKPQSECKFSATKLNQSFLKNNNAKENTDEVNEEIRKINEKSANIIPKFKFKDITENEVIKVIKSLKSSSCGVDGISAYFIKLASNFIAKPLSNIINASFHHRTFPKRWKYAIVKPIPKVTKPSSESEYRPISLLTVHSKILEKVATYQIIKYLQEQKLQDIYQSAYKANHSTITALLNISDDIYNALDDSELTIMVLIDYSKAFDTINHRILYAKLKKLGFHFEAISWIVSYLTDRKQKVKTLSDESGWEDVHNGVPQGSVIGPLLFSIMVHDISEYITESNYHMYADDTQVFKRSNLNLINQSIKDVNTDLERISDFSKRNCLKINEGKSQLIIFGSRKMLSKLNETRLDNILINNKVISRETTVKNLGIEFDQQLTWKDQINKQVKNAYYKLHQLYRFHKFLSEKCKLRLVETFVLSQLTYGDIVTQNTTLELQNKLQKVQNACYRFVFGVKKYDHITPYINQAKSLKMAARTKLHALVQMHKIILNKAPTYLCNRVLYRNNIHNINTRNRNQLHLKKLKINIKKGAFFNQTAIDYNLLISLKITDFQMSVASFKRACKTHLLDCQLNSN